MAAAGNRLTPRLVLLFALAVASIAALLYSVHGQRQRDALRVGEPSPHTYVTPVDTDVIDRIATERQRQAAREQIAPVFIADARLQQLMLSSIAAAGLPEEVQDLLASAYRQPEGVTAGQIPNLIAEAVALTAPERQREVRLGLERRLLATSVPSSRLTEAARDAAAAAIQPVMQSLQAGQVVVRAGEPLTDDHLRVLEALGLYSARFDLLRQTASIVLGCVLLAVLLALPLLYAASRLPQLTFQQLLFLTLLTLVALAAQRVALMASPNFLIIMVVPILVAALVSDAAAVIWAVWLTALVTLLAPAAPLFTFVTAGAGAVTAALLGLSIKARTSLILAGGLGGLAGAAALVGSAFMVGGFTGLSLLTSALIIVAGGVISGVIAVGLLALAESEFGFLTDFRLVELSSPTTPLLQKLLLEAPGTYQHSLIISNLVEQAVKRIGGNALLARVGALYHDVGKLRRPHFFAENQFSGENPHDHLSPHLSYLIITTHVREGLELLRTYRLPPALEPFVAEHHGTTILSYFYKRALEETAGLDELNFRYPGPRPRSRETAVLMLADAVESASRTLREPSQGSIRALIDRLVEERLQDDQLSESQLNFHDLEVIKETFERMLTAILHRRVSYPTAAEIGGLKRAVAAQPAGVDGSAEARRGRKVGGDGAHGGDPRRNEPLST